MLESNSLSEEQREVAVELFEAGWGARAVATHLRVGVKAIGRLHDRWRVRGGTTLVSKPTKRVFSFEFKMAAMQRYLMGENKIVLSKELGLSSPTLIGKWVRLYRDEGENGLRPKPKGRPKGNPSKGLEGQGTAVTVRAVIALKAEQRFDVLLDVAALARSRFFYHRARLRAPDSQEALKSAITDVFGKNHGRYGHRRIHTELLKQGWTVAKKTVLKLMRTLGLACRVRRKKRYVSYQGEEGRIAPNLLSRGFDAETPNQKWVTDVTEFNVGDRKLYLSPVMDLFDRQIRWYNNDGISIKLKGLSPVQYRTQALAS